VIDTLSELFAMRGVPRHIHSDNGPDSVAQTLRRWLKQEGVGALDIELGTPLGERLRLSTQTRTIPGQGHPGDGAWLHSWG